MSRTVVQNNGRVVEVPVYAHDGGISPRKPPLARIEAMGPCAKCGLVHHYALCHRKGDGEPCRNYPVNGQNICRLHGGNSAQARKAAAKRIVKARAMNEVGELVSQALEVVGAKLGVEQLTEAITRAGAMALAYEWLLAELPIKSRWSFQTVTDKGGKPTRFVNVQTEGLVGPDAQGVMRLHVYEEGLRYWTTLHGKLLKTAADIGLEERRQRFAEDTVRTIGNAIRTIVAGLGRELDDPAVVPVVEAALAMIVGESAAR